MLKPQKIDCSKSLIESAFFLVLLVGCCAPSQDLLRTQQEQAATTRSLNAEIARLNEELDKLLVSQKNLEKSKAELENKFQTLTTT